MITENFESHIKEVWAVEQEILDVFHEICKEHHLRYSLAYGTLLGAVRHKGFIPWDDDIDIMMPREDYNRLLAIWKEVAPAGYLLQNHETNPDYMQSFTKILKDHTTFLQEEWAREKCYHKGFFIDIFPGDRVAPAGVSRKIQYIWAAVDLLYTRNHTSGSTGVKGIAEKWLLLLPQKMKAKLRIKAEKAVRKWNKQGKTEYFFPCTIRDCSIRYDKDLFLNYSKMEFNGKVYYGTQIFHSYLRTQYGDYMQLPPEDQRVWKHHPILIDFEHNYEELPNE